MRSYILQVILLEAVWAVLLGILCCLGDGGCSSRQGSFSWGPIPSLTADRLLQEEGRCIPCAVALPALEPALLAWLRSSASFDCLPVVWFIILCEESSYWGKQQLYFPPPICT